MSVHTPGKQEYRKTASRQDMGNSWFYLFMYRYPDSPLVPEIEELLETTKMPSMTERSA